MNFQPDHLLEGGVSVGFLPVFVTIRMEYDELGKDIKILMG